MKAYPRVYTCLGEVIRVKRVR